MASTVGIQELKQAILDFEEDKAIAAAKKVIREGEPVLDAIGAMGDALKELGDKFQAMEVFLPELLLATDAFKAAMKILEPELKKSGGAAVVNKPKVVIATVKGDVHAVGKDLVGTMLTIGGFEVKDLGVDVDSEVIVKEAEAIEAQVIALSALMSTTMPGQKEVIEFLKAKNIRNKYTVIIGGGPTTQQWADTIGADGWSKVAVESVGMVKKLIGMQ